MKKQFSAAQSRQRLDQRLQAIGPVELFNPPISGWIKAIRIALGMTTTQMAARMSLNQSTIVALENSEAKANIQLATLHKAAAALGCTLVYALVPNKPLEETVRERASEYARKHLAPIEHSMALEDQKVTDIDSEARIDEIIRDTNPRRFWD